MALPRRALLSSLAVVAAAGCTSDGPGGTVSSTASDTPTDTESPTGTEPAYLQCDRATIEKDLPDDAVQIPASLTENSVAEYVERLEEFVALPLTDGEPDGYVSIGDVTVETVDYGYVATVQVTGGYYNQEADYATETVHYDMAPYTATYFVSDGVVRRAEDNSAELDPRQSGEFVVCDG